MKVAIEQYTFRCQGRYAEMIQIVSWCVENIVSFVQYQFDTNNYPDRWNADTPALMYVTISNQGDAAIFRTFWEGSDDEAEDQ